MKRDGTHYQYKYYYFEAMSELDPQVRKAAQRRILVEHVFNTLADRMWLYAAGLLLIDVVLRIEPSLGVKFT